MKILFLKLLILIAVLGLSACTSTPVPTGDRLMSVSWVNPTPANLTQVETKITGSDTPVKLENLPAYTEIAVETDQPLYKNGLIKTQLVIGTEKINLQPMHLEPPLRKSPEGEYNLRIQIHPGLPPVANLEPIRLTRARLGN